MRQTTLDDFVRVAHGGREASTSAPSLSGLAPASAALTIADDDTPTTTTGSFTTEPADLIPVVLTAGTTYTFAQRPTATGGIEDPYLLLATNPDGTGIIAQDDDGGLGRSSMITFTPTESGTYYVVASSWYHQDPTAPGYPDYRD